MSEIYAPGSIAGPPTTFMGPYNSGTAYAVGEAVSSSGSSYVSLIAANIGNNPAATPNQWALLAAGGAAGANGTNGFSGLSVVTVGGGTYNALATDDIILYTGSSYVQVANSTDAVGRVRMVVNRTAGALGVANGGQYIANISVGEAGSFICASVGSMIAASPSEYNAYAQISNGPTYTTTYGQRFITYTYAGPGSITLANGLGQLAGAGSNDITLLNYTNYPLTIYPGNNPGVTLGLKETATYKCAGGGDWVLVGSTVSPVMQAAPAVFAPSGGSHGTGLVPDPGAVSGATRYLREDATWSAPAAGSGSGALAAMVNQFTAPQILQMGPTTQQGVLTFGDSITNGAGATNTTNTYSSILGRAFGYPYVNYGAGGDQATDQALKVHSNTNPLPAHNPTITLCIAHNDIAYASGSSVPNATLSQTLLRFQSTMLATVTWATLPNTAKVFGQNASLYGGHATLTGTFAANTSLVGNLGAMAVTGTASGDTVTASITTVSPNQAVYVTYLGQDGNGGSASVSIDGKVVGTLLAQGPGGTIATVNGGTTAPYGARYIVATPGNHSMVLTITSATATSNSFTFLWAGTQNLHAPLPGEPRVFVLDPVYEAGMNQSTISDQYIGVLSLLIPQLVSDGLLVQRVITNNFVINSLGMATQPTTAPDGTAIPASTIPGLHPNDYGHAEMANAVLVYAQPTAAPGAGGLNYPFVNAYEGYTIANNADQAIWMTGSNINVPLVPVQGEAHMIYNYGSTLVTINGLHAGAISSTIAPQTAAMIVCNGGWWRFF